jgi:hypothetical protein
MWFVFLQFKDDRDLRVTSSCLFAAVELVPQPRADTAAMNAEQSVSCKHIIIILH